MGLETAYLFGKITNSRRLQLDSSSIAYGTELADDISLRGLRLKAGFQAAIDFGKKKIRINQFQTIKDYSFPEHTLWVVLFRPMPVVFIGENCI